MRTEVLLLLIIGICACVVAGCVVAETVMYPDDGMENVTFNNTNSTVNMTNNTTNNTTDVTIQKHSQPKGIFHKILRKIHDPFDDTPEIAPGIKKFRQGLWIKNSHNEWVQIATLDSHDNIIGIYTSNPYIIHILTRYVYLSPDTVIHHIPMSKLFGDNSIVLNDATITDNNITINNTTMNIDDNMTDVDFNLDNDTQIDDLEYDDSEILNEETDEANSYDYDSYDYGLDYGDSLDYEY